MPSGFGGPLSTEFRYITVEDLRNEGIDATLLPDDRAKSLIIMVSNQINWLTKQWFVPVRLKAKVDARGSSIFHLPTMVPILDLFAVKLGREDLSIVDLVPISYAVKERYVMMLSPRARLTTVPLFVTLDGVFGWVEDDFAPSRTTITTAVNKGDTTIQVQSLVGINPGDVLLVGSQPEPFSGAVLVKSTADPSTVNVEPVRFSCPVGSPAVRYGRVPSMIQRAATLLVKDKIVPIGKVGTCEDPYNPMWFAQRLQNESVEGYSYGMAALPSAYGPGGGTWTTGNPEVDDILTQYAFQGMYVGAMG